MEDLVMNLPMRIVIVSVIDISATDSAIFYHLKQHPENLTIPLLAAWILITLLPIGLVLLVWQYQHRQR
jgi:hypothetical protein